MLKCESLRSIEGGSVINHDIERPKNEEDKHMREEKKM